MSRFAAYLRVLLVFVFISITPAFSFQQSNKYAKEIAAIEETIQKNLAVNKNTAISIAFMKDGFTWAKGFGYADLENKVPATEHSAYRLASVTKPMTAVAILQLVEQGKINLDAEVQTYVPYFPRKRGPITVRQLLGHIGGISHYKDPVNELHIKEPKTTRESIAIFEDFDLVAEPGTRYNYSSYGYNLLGAVVEGASGMPYGEYMTKYVWEPAGMSDTRMDSPREIIPNRVRGYVLENGKLVNSEYVDISSRFAAGGTRSTVLDLLKFAQGVNDGKLLKPATRAMMFEPMVLKNGRMISYGMGWSIETTYGRLRVSHGGSQNETRTMLYNFPGLNFILAVASNYENVDGTFVQDVVAIVLGEPMSIPSYTQDKSLDGVRRALYSITAFGPEDVKTYGARTAANEKELAEAFAYVNTWVSKDAFDSNSEEARTKVLEGPHPAANKPFLKTGAFMAGAITKAYGAERLNSYFKAGVFPFFADYVQAYQNDKTIPAELRFSKSLEELVLKWNTDWQKAWTAETRTVSISTGTDFDALGKQLRRAFQGAEVYPNYIDDMGFAVRDLTVAGKKEQALSAGTLGVELYPSSDLLNAYYGISLTLFGDEVKGFPFIEKAAKLNPTGAGGPGGLNNVAYGLLGRGMVDEGLVVLNTAVKLYPKEANLYDSIGEFYVNKGQKDKAIEYYKKALEINPKFESSLKALENLTKSASEK
ncbi:MAG: serine hydrolase [Ignavibacteriae bacterium]|nr:serine hydrolase [Ignavibacteriota bacterium]